VTGTSYAGQILQVDLTTGKSIAIPLDFQVARSYIGGLGINTWLAHEYLPPGVSPLSPQNKIILGAGSLAGTMAPGSGRLSMITKLPEVNSISCSSSSMSFSSIMKYAGYDHLVISGRAENPVYLYIEDSRVTICDAKSLWGKDIYQTTDMLWQKHSRESSVIAIGQAGENLLPISLALVDRVASLGNKGGASVLGSKNLKAIVIKGSGGIGVANPGQYIKLINAALNKSKNDPKHAKWVESGHMSKWPNPDFSYHHRDKVFAGEKASEIIGPDVYLHKVKKRRLSCPSCTYADKEILGVSEGEFKGLTTTISAWAMGNENFGVQCQVDSYDKILKCLDTVQRYGLCRHATTTVIDYAVQLYDEGIITRRDTDGLALRRDYETTCTLIEWMVSGRSIGSILGKGIQGLARALGTEEREDYFAAKSSAVTMDPRLMGFDATVFEHIVNFKGYHFSVDTPPYDSEHPGKFKQALKGIGIPNEALSKIMDSQTGFNIGRLTRYSEDWKALSDSLGFCTQEPYRGFWSLSDYYQLFSAGTGLDVTAEEMMRAAERSWNLLRMLNVREGFSRQQDRYPKKWLEPLEKPNGEKIYTRNRYDKRIMTAEVLEQMLDDYYEERGWNKRSGIPKPAKLAELGLKEVLRHTGPKSS
jgi:aldehyde:ferredoxin oxidoreductase